MANPFQARYSGNRPLEEKIGQLREQVQSLDPQDIAFRTGIDFLPGSPAILQIPWWGQNLRLLWPDLVPELEEKSPPRNDVLALWFYHFLVCHAVPLSGEWISFSELPDGRFYAQAYQGYSGDLLRARFGNDQDAFERAVLSAGGSRLDASTGLPEAAYAFRPLPRLALLAVMWPGDEDFPSSYQVLFEASISKRLPTDACAILGGMLARRIVKTAAIGQP